MIISTMPETMPEILAQTLKSHNLSMTKTRLLVFNLLVDQEPLSIREIYNRAKKQVDRASLYRVIHAFERSGVVQRIYVGWKYKLELTDIFSNHHHHISCPGCGKIMAIGESQAIEKFINDLARQNKVKAISHQLEIQAYCHDCLAKLRTTKA